MCSMTSEAFTKSSGLPSPATQALASRRNASPPFLVVEPSPPRVTADDRNAHRAFVRTLVLCGNQGENFSPRLSRYTLGSEAIWLNYDVIYAATPTAPRTGRSSRRSAAMRFRATTLLLGEKKVSRHFLWSAPTICGRVAGGQFLDAAGRTDRARRHWRWRSPAERPTGPTARRRARTAATRPPRTGVCQFSNRSPSVENGN
jgi:hypothetical protein